MSNQYNRKQFLQYYLSFINVLNQKQSSLFWWATDLSSKNRFTSNFVLRLEDVFLNKSVRVSEPRMGIFATVKYVLRWLWHATRMLLRVVWIKIRLGSRFVSFQQVDQSFYLLKSFVYPRSFTRDGKYADAFFGVLPSFIQRKNNVLVLVDVPTQFFKCVELLRNVDDDIVVMPWEYFLSPIDILVYMVKGLMYCPRKIGQCMFGSVDVTWLINEYTSYGQLKIQPYQMYHYPAFVRLYQKINIHTLLLTHESNPWERMCILATRTYAPEACILGYQHNVVPQASANMFIDHDEWGHTPLPDKIITTGEAPRKVLQENGFYPENVIYTGCALRIEPFENRVVRKNKIKRILVAMEGVDGAYVLAQYAIDQLKNHPDYEVVFRTHPVLPWSYFQKKYGCDLTPYKHFYLSVNRTLKEDIARADVVLYWGSTVGMESLGLGKPVIHFDNGALLSFDPLFDCNYLKWVVGQEMFLLDIFRAIDEMSDEDFMDQKRLSMGYLQEYFHPVSDQAMEVFIQ